MLDDVDPFDSNGFDVLDGRLGPDVDVRNPLLSALTLLPSFRLTSFECCRMVTIWLTWLTKNQSAHKQTASIEISVYFRTESRNKIKNTYLLGGGVVDHLST